MRDFEAEARQLKVDAVVPVLTELYRAVPVASFQCWSFDDSKAGAGAQGPRPSITEWLSDPTFPWWVVQRLAKVRPLSPTSKAMVLAALSEVG